MRPSTCEETEHTSVFAVIGYIFLCSPCFSLESLENSFSSGPIYFSEILDSRTTYFLFFFFPLSPLFLLLLFWGMIFLYALPQTIRRYLRRTKELYELGDCLFSYSALFCGSLGYFIFIQ